MAKASAEKLEHTGLAEKERVACLGATERAVGKNAGAALAKGKGTEPSVQSIIS